MNEKSAITKSPLHKQYALYKSLGDTIINTLKNIEDSDIKSRVELNIMNILLEDK